MHVNIDQQFLLLLPGSLINIYTFSIPPPSLRTRQACATTVGNGSSIYVHLGCEKRYVWKYASFEMYLHAYRRRRKRSRTLLPFTLPRRGCWDYHPVACTHCLVIGFVRKLFKFDQRMPLTRRVYMCVCVQFLMQRGGVERALGCFVAFVRSKFFLGIFIGKRLIFVLSPCATRKMKMPTE